MSQMKAIGENDLRVCSRDELPLMVVEGAREGRYERQRQQRFSCGTNSEKGKTISIGDV